MRTYNLPPPETLSQLSQYFAERKVHLEPKFQTHHLGLKIQIHLGPKIQINLGPKFQIHFFMEDTCITTKKIE